MATLELHQIRKAYANGIDVLKGIDLTIHDREFIVFIGPSGCGKSTLLRVIAGLEGINTGELRIDEKRVNEIPADRRGLAMVFQSYALYPHMTVADNMAFALRLSHVPKKERQKKIHEAARILELEPFLDRKPKQLSGGQRQRVAIGRAIVREPKAFLFDEPLSNLDAALRTQMRYKIAKLHRDLNTTTIYVTHDQTEAMTLADRIVVLNSGHIEQVGTPLELYLKPANMFVAGFIGAPKINFLPATIGQSRTENGLSAFSRYSAEIPLFIESWPHQDQNVTLGIRPEDVYVASNGPIRGTVDLVEHLGSETIICVAIGAEEPFTVKLALDTDVKVGETISLGIKPNAIILFDSNSDAVYRSGKNDLSDTLPDKTQMFRYSA